MDIRDFRIMVRKHAPWLLEWVASRMGHFKMRNQTHDAFEMLVAEKIESIQEVPWKDLKVNEETQPSTTPVEGHVGKYMITSGYYTVVWRKNDEEKIRYTGIDKLAGLSVDKLLRLMISECGDGDTPWVTAAVETIYTINTDLLDAPKYRFVIYPSNENAFMLWVDQHKDEINHVLAQRNMILSSYSIVARHH